MAKETFGVGDTVMLKSGGPVMTVQEVPLGTFNDGYNCQWFAGRKLESGNFPLDSLVEAEPQPNVEAPKK